MPRIRTIKPQFFRSHQIADLSSDACRLTCIGLWTYCDDAGRGIDDARVVKGEIWPLHDRVTAKVVEKHLAELAAGDDPIICRYVSAGRRYLHVVKWAEHQRVNRPTPSRIPPCLRHESSLKVHGGLTEDSLNAHDRNKEGNKEGNKEVEGKWSREKGMRVTSSSSQPLVVIHSREDEEEAS